MAFFVAEGVAALVEPGGPGGSVVVTDGRLRDDAAFGGNGFYPWPDAIAAQVVLATEQYNRSPGCSRPRFPVTLEMNIANTYHTAEPDSFNIIAEIPGTDLRQEAGDARCAFRFPGMAGPAPRTMPPVAQWCSRRSES